MEKLSLLVIQLDSTPVMIDLEKMVSCLCCCVSVHVFWQVLKYLFYILHHAELDLSVRTKVDDHTQIFVLLAS